MKNINDLIDDYHFRKTDDLVRSFIDWELNKFVRRTMWEPVQDIIWDNLRAEGKRGLYNETSHTFIS